MSMLLWGDPVTPAEELRYIATHTLLPILCIVAVVAAITVTLIVLLKKKKRGN
ncbi:MAG: hypothetical protein IJI34_10410 [Clostridia bacterium]|nr:hypothetical protein [Clostridia bacterium]